MGSETHRPGTPTNPLLIGKRTRRAVMERERELSADLRLAVYVRPLGRGLHLIRNECSPREYAVTSKAGITFSPGAYVALGSHTGRPGEFILGVPGANRAGASRYVPLELGKVTTLGAPVVAGCPQPITGKTYLALFDDGSSFHASIYADGAWQSDVASKNHTAEAWTDRLDLHPGSWWVSGDKVVLWGRKVTSPTRTWWVTWDTAANTFSTIELLNDGGCYPVVDGLTIYMAETSVPDPLSALGAGPRLWSAPVGTAGNLNTVATEEAHILHPDPADSYFIGVWVMLHGDGVVAFDNSDGITQWYGRFPNSPEVGPLPAAAVWGSNTGAPISAGRTIRSNGGGGGDSGGYIIDSAGVFTSIWTPSLGAASWATVLGEARVNPARDEVVIDLFGSFARFRVSDLPLALTADCEAPIITAANHPTLGVAPAAMLPRD